MNKKVCIYYIICIHIILVAVLIKPDFISQVNRQLGAQPPEITKHFRSMVAFHSRIDKNLPPKSILFIGDSHIQGLAVSAISPNAVNYGIGKDTTVGVMQRLHYYKSIPASKSVVLAIGFNDLKRRENENILQNIEKILDYFPAKIDIILCAIHPVGENKHAAYNERIKDLNKSLKKISMQYNNVTYLNSFNSALSSGKYLLPKYHLPDGIHLSKEGYSVWIAKLANTLSKIKE